MLREAYFLPSPPESIEFRAFTHGLMPKSVPAMMQHFVSDWQLYGVDAWNEVPNHWRPASDDLVGWWTLPTYLGDEFIAPLLGAPAGTCIMQPNVHWIVQCLLSSRELFTKKRKVILSEAEFPSVVFSIRQWADQFDLEIIMLPLQHDAFPKQAFLDAIDDQTALVFLSHVGFTTGERLTDDCIQEIAQKVHQKDGILAVDGYHSIGTMTSSVSGLDVDLYFGGLLKEGSGSSGNAYLYVRPELDLTPRLTGWLGDHEPFAFNVVPKHNQEVRNRFMGGTTAIASYYHAVEGVKLLLNAGLQNVRKDSLIKTEHCIQHAQEIGIVLRSPTQEENRSAMVVLELPQAHLMSLFLRQHHIFTDSRQQKYLRIAPFVWNSLAEIDRTFEAIKKGLLNNKYLHTKATKKPGPVT